VVVDDPSVSSNHCRLTQTPNGFVLEDLQSTNGTCVNGKPLRGSVQVSTGDQIILGLAIPFPWPRGIDVSAPQPPIQRPRELQPKPSRDVDRLSAPRMGKSLVFGRDPNCDQVLDYPMISRRHARLFTTQDGLFLEDLGSSNGTFLSGRRVKRPMR